MKKDRWFRLRGFDLTRAQDGWTCDVCFGVQTANQFTYEVETIHSGGRWLLTAIWNGWRAARKRATFLRGVFEPAVEPAMSMPFDEAEGVVLSRE